jgi:hypothetical protein
MRLLQMRPVAFVGRDIAHRDVGMDADIFGHRSNRQIDAMRKVPNIESIAARERYSPRDIRLMPPLAFLAPHIVMAILANAIPVDLGISRPTDGLPYSWKQQRDKFGF